MKDKSEKTYPTGYVFESIRAENVSEREHIHTHNSYVDKSVLLTVLDCDMALSPE